jgi:predicted DNA-binding protein with PD1-like motif
VVSLKTSTGFLLRFDQGEEFIRLLTHFCQENNIQSGWVSGLGGALWADLAFYHLDQKAYEFDRIDEPLEVASLTGNITLVNNQPFLHVHAVVSDLNYHAYAGHLKELAVAATLEVKLEIADQPINRVHNDASGLKIFDF